MSTDLTSAPNLVGVRHAALRLAFGVTGCFALVEALGWDATFLAPMLAAQMLTKLQKPPSPAQGVVLVALICVSTGLVLTVTAAFIGHPAVLLLALALLLYLSFYTHLRGAPELATLLVQISAVSIPVLAVASPDAAAGFAVTLVSAGIVALLTVWVAFAAFPGGAADDSAEASGKLSRIDQRAAARAALLNTLIVLPILTWFVLVATELAVVVLIVVVTLLRQHDPRQGQRAALGLILGNLVGGLAAAVVYNLVLFNETFLFFVMVCLASILAFAGRIATAGSLAPIYVIALATFILLLGLGMSPLPGGSGEAFASRLANVLMASAYAIGALSVVERWRIQPIPSASVSPAAQ